MASLPLLDLEKPSLPSPGDGSLPDLVSMPPARLREWVAGLGEPPFRAAQLLKWIHKRSVRDFASMTDLSRDLRARLPQVARLGCLKVVEVQASADGTRKYRMGTEDGALIEAVFIPSAAAEDRNTLCISTQVGCAMRCAFCATGALGLKRHLTAGEIVDQVNRVWTDLKASAGGFVPDPAGPSGRRVITNLVFMGMGEPLHNLDNVLASLAILSEDDAHQFSPRRMTVSTSGLVPQMQRLMEETDVQLAVSLSGTTDEQRAAIMPVNRKYNLEALMGACRRVPLKARRRITFEYVLLSGVNDADADARRLVGLLHGLKCKVNLIPFNEHPLSPFQRPPRARVLAFQEILRAAGVNTLIRDSRGDDIDAACGMLGGHKLEEQRKARPGRE